MTAAVGAGFEHIAGPVLESPTPDKLGAVSSFDLLDLCLARLEASA